MKTAITVWESKISPVFDAAHTLLVVEIAEALLHNRQQYIFQAGIFAELLGLLKRNAVELFICGALCRGPVAHLESQGITVLPFLTGDVEELLDCLCHQRPLDRFVMPGCGAVPCCRTRIPNRLGRTNGWHSPTTHSGRGHRGRLKTGR